MCIQICRSSRLLQEGLWLEFWWLINLASIQVSTVGCKTGFALVRILIGSKTESKGQSVEVSPYSKFLETQSGWVQLRSCCYHNIYICNYVIALIVKVEGLERWKAIHPSIHLQVMGAIFLAQTTKGHQGVPKSAKSYNPSRLSCVCLGSLSVTYVLFYSQLTVVDLTPAWICPKNVGFFDVWMGLCVWRRTSSVAVLVAGLLGLLTA